MWAWGLNAYKPKAQMSIQETEDATWDVETTQHRHSSLLLADGNRAPPPGRGAYRVGHRYYESGTNLALGELRFQSWVTNWVGTQRVVCWLLYKEMELKTMVLRDERRVFQTERPNALRSHVYMFNKGAPGPRTPLTCKTCLRNWHGKVDECL